MNYKTSVISSWRCLYLCRTLPPPAFFISTTQKLYTSLLWSTALVYANYVWITFKLYQPFFIKKNIWTTSIKTSFITEDLHARNLNLEKQETWMALSSNPRISCEEVRFEGLLSIDKGNVTRIVLISILQIDTKNHIKGHYNVLCFVLDKVLKARGLRCH